MNFWITFTLILFIIAFVLFYVEHLEYKTFDRDMTFCEAVIDDFREVVMILLFFVILFMCFNL